MLEDISILTGAVVPWEWNSKIWPWPSLVQKSVVIDEATRPSSTEPVLLIRSRTDQSNPCSNWRNLFGLWSWKTPGTPCQAGRGCGRHQRWCCYRNWNEGEGVEDALCNPCCCWGRCSRRWSGSASFTDAVKKVADGLELNDQKGGNCPQALEALFVRSLPMQASVPDHWYSKIRIKYLGWFRCSFGKHGYDPRVSSIQLKWFYRIRDAASVAGLVLTTEAGYMSFLKIRTRCLQFLQEEVWVTWVNGRHDVIHAGIWCILGGSSRAFRLFLLLKKIYPLRIKCGLTLFSELPGFFTADKKL